MTITHIVEVETLDGDGGHGRVAYDEACGMYIGLIGEAPATDYGLRPIEVIDRMANVLSENAFYCHVNVQEV